MPIGNQPPVTNKAAADKNKAATAIHMQDKFKAGAAPQDTSTIQKLGAAFTGEQAQQDIAASGAQAASEVGAIEREQRVGEIEQTGQNIQDQERLTKSIEDQKNSLVEMDIGITEDEFADKMTIDKLNEDQDFQNDTQLNDLARLTFESDEEYQDMLQQSYQHTLQQQKDDEWELSVYNRAENDTALREKLAEDQKKASEIAHAKAMAEEKAKAAAEKAGKTKEMVGVAKVIVGAAITYFSGGTAAGAGTALMADGAGDVASES